MKVKQQLTAAESPILVTCEYRSCGGFGYISCIIRVRKLCRMKWRMGMGMWHLCGRGKNIHDFGRDTWRKEASLKVDARNIFTWILN